MVNVMAEFFMTTFWKWLIINVFDFIGNYGLRVILLTVAIKLVLAPVDFYTRKMNKDNAAKMELMKPELEKLQKQYANNPTELQRRKGALNKKYGYNIMGACLPLILTMFIFFTLFSGYRATEKQLNVQMYENLSGAYNEYYGAAVDNAEADIDEQYIIKANLANLEWYDYELAALRLNKANKDKSDEDLTVLLAEKLGENAIYTEEAPFNEDNIKAASSTHRKQYERVSSYIAQGIVLEQYESTEKESFLWIKNVWRSDTWTNPIYSSRDFKTLTGLGDPVGVDASGSYNEVMGRVQNSYHGQWNGFLILVVLSVGFNFLSQFVMRRQQNTAADPTQANMMGSMKIMMLMMPVMIGFFALSQSSAFTLYMVTNAVMTLTINLASTLVLKIMDKTKKPEDIRYS